MDIWIQFDWPCSVDHLSYGNYCYPHLQSTTSQDECDECGLKMFQAELSNGYFYNDDLASLYISLTSSCGVSTLPLPTPTSVVVSRYVVRLEWPLVLADFPFSQVSQCQ